MLKNRLIPVLFLKHGWLVRSEGFEHHQNLGNPVAQVDRYSAWNVDELIYIDITPDDSYDTKRDDLGGVGSANPSTFLEIIRLVASRAFMPLTVGGKIRTLEDARQRLRLGADKITLNTQALTDPTFISACAEEFGSQAIVVSVDVRGMRPGEYQVFADAGRTATGRDPVRWCEEVARRGAGEILLNSIDRDGDGGGYDLALIRAVAGATQIPVIALGGVGDFSHFAKAIEAGAQAAAAGNIFNFKEHSYPLAKRQMKKQGINVR
jgi:cyclase